MDKHFMRSESYVQLSKFIKTRADWKILWAKQIESARKSFGWRFGLE